MEHLEHFGLAQEPFSNDPILRFYHPSRAHVDAARRILRGVHQGKGLTLLLGPGGCGKTMLARHLLEGLDEERFEPVLLVLVQRCADGRSLLLRIAGQLGVEEPAEEDGPLLGQLYQRLVDVREEGRRGVVLVEDAQMLATRGAVEGLRALLSLEHDERRLVSLVLIGTPELEQALALDPALPERVDIRVHLDALDAESAAEYVAHRVRTAGGDPSLLDAESVAALHSMAGGVPRVMNTLADNAMYEAYLGGRKRVEKEDIERAASDLGLDERGQRMAARRGAASHDDPAASAQPDAGARAAGSEARADDTIPPSLLGDSDDGRSDVDLELGESGADTGNAGGSESPLAVTQVLEDTARDLEDLEDEDLETTFGLEEDAVVPEVSGEEAPEADLPASASDAGSAVAGDTPQPILSMNEPPKDEELDDLFAELIDEDESG